MIERHDVHKVFENLQHEFEQKLINHFPDLDYSEVRDIINDTLDKVYDYLENRELVIVNDDDLSCMESDYEEACDRLMTIRELANECQGYVASITDSPNNQGDLDNAFMTLENIIYEVER